MIKIPFIHGLMLVSMLTFACVAGADVDTNTTKKVYQVGAEDILDIFVWREESLQKSVLVRPDGGISFPLIGNLQAAGKSLAQLSEEVKNKLQTYISDPVVTVSLNTIGSNKIYVLGNVNKPGVVQPGRYVDVMQVLSMAGGLGAFAKEKKIRIIRRMEDGRQRTISFNYESVLKGNLKQNIVLENGDVVVVP